mmetsp:Transcript_103638/g.269972  ORF Transcript_103638/g.269972 Transcript_103638/m.269972 type:complete len:106 (+) Transcript_103638:404-721(+)
MCREGGWGEASVGSVDHGAELREGVTTCTATAVEGAGIEVNLGTLWLRHPEEGRSCALSLTSRSGSRLPTPLVGLFQVWFEEVPAPFATRSGPPRTCVPVYELLS